ncbi:MAG TPA: hydrogenase expression/formation protein HypE [Tepidisphaeraceae bacterium]|nr:hydrogenase expression/formation protein HypE [Tepidisphaeraceae bacterium]
MTRQLDFQQTFLRNRRTHISMAHGGGGQLTDDLVQSVFLPRFGNEALNDLLDSAVVPLNGASRMAMTIDGYVVQPLKFPGGDIGRLAVSGTVNDLAVTGARPQAIALGLILAEGLDQDVLEDVMDSIAATTAEAGVQVVTGDTKVVGRNQADGMYITTAGIGTFVRKSRLHPDRIEPGDVIIVNGPIADHGLAVMLAREMPQVKSALRSDVAPLNNMIQRLLAAVPDISFMRDPTRGGIAGLCADLAARTGWHIRLDETRIPIRPETHHAAEMLGLDPLDVANEGKVVIVARASDADNVLNALRNEPLAADAQIIGQVEQPADGLCELVTKMGGRRVIHKPYGEQLPRIC